LSVVQSGDIVRTDTLIEQQVIQRLKGEPVYQLLEIFTWGTYKDYIEFYEKSGNVFFLGKNVDQTELTNKIRLLTLNGLASKADKLSYQEIAEGLDIDESDVELWVVEAITQGLIDVRVDQCQKSVKIRYAEARNFKEKEWKVLKDRVDRWNHNITSILEVVRGAKIKAAEMTSK
jgi:predicted transcriptional regulator